jgi:hypothetical protein
MKKAVALTAAVVALCMVIAGCDAQGELPAGDADTVAETVQKQPDNMNIDTDEDNPGIVLDEEKANESANKVAEAFVSPEDHKGLVIDAEMKIYSEPESKDGTICFSAHLSGDEEKTAYISLMDPHNDMSFSKGDQIRVVGMVADKFNCVDTKAKEKDMPLISATSVEKIESESMDGNKELENTVGESQTPKQTEGTQATQSPSESDGSAPQQTEEPALAGPPQDSPAAS